MSKTFWATLGLIACIAVFGTALLLLIGMIVDVKATL